MPAAYLYTLQGSLHYLSLELLLLPHFASGKHPRSDGWEVGGQGSSPGTLSTQQTSFNAGTGVVPFIPFPQGRHDFHHSTGKASAVQRG